MSLISVPVSFGELIDKITILEIKAERIGQPPGFNGYAGPSVGDLPMLVVRLRQSP